MAKIFSLKIFNFRGIKNFDYVFNIKSDFVCLIGRCNSGKSTLLEAISYVLSPKWNLSFNDSDFYDCNIENNIEIEVTLYDMPLQLIREDKYGLYIRSIDADKNEMLDEVIDGGEIALTIKLIVDNNLEPHWYVINERHDPIPFKSNDRALLNVFLISDYLDKHFSWSKGSPLYSLLRKSSADKSSEEVNVIIKSLREAKTRIDHDSFEHLNELMRKIQEKAVGLGINVENPKTTVDFKDFLLKDNKLCLHDDQIPFRLKGKGAKRLLSISIQMELAQSGGIILIDEIEQGLEPDRAQHLAKTLKNNNGQVFITTHSRDVLVELEANNLFLMRQGNKNLIKADKGLQGCIRKNPEAFFSNRVIVCEGATEVGFCRAINHFRITNGRENATIKGVSVTDGTGSKSFVYAENFIDMKFDVCLVCDSDKETDRPKKDKLKLNGVKIIEWEEGNSIEKQIFLDLPWEGVKELIKYRIEEESPESVEDSVRSKLPELKSHWQEKETDELRRALGELSSTKSWFKCISKAEFLGEVCCKYLNEMEDKKLKQQINELSEWIDNDKL